MGGQGADHLLGSLGEDVLLGGLGSDLLEGAGGADVFLYTAAAQSTLAERDRIGGFETGIDKIDLRAVRTGAIDAFQITTSGPLTLLNVDLGGDGSIDMQIALLNNAVLQSSDVLF
jgi:serralysin